MVSQNNIIIKVLSEVVKVKAVVESAKHLIQITRENIVQSNFLSFLNDEARETLEGLNSEEESEQLSQLLDQLKITMSNDEMLLFEIKEFEKISVYLNTEMQPGNRDWLSSLLETLTHLEEAVKALDDSDLCQTEKETHIFLYVNKVLQVHLPAMIKEAYMDLLQDHSKNLDYLEDALRESADDKTSEDKISAIICLGDLLANKYSAMIAAIEPLDILISDEFVKELKAFEERVGYYPCVYADHYFAQQEEVQNVSLISEGEAINSSFDRLSVSPSSTIWKVRPSVSPNFENLDNQFVAQRRKRSNAFSCDSLV